MRPLLALTFMRLSAIRNRILDLHRDAIAKSLVIVVGLIAGIADERDESVKEMIRMVIATAKRRGKKIGICGQGPSDFPEFATFLVELGIDSMSLIPDTAVKTRLAVAEKEKELGISPE